MSPLYQYHILNLKIYFTLLQSIIQTPPPSYPLHHTHEFPTYPFIIQHENIAREQTFITILPSPLDKLFTVTSTTQNHYPPKLPLPHKPPRSIKRTEFLQNSRICYRIESARSSKRETFSRLLRIAMQ